MLVTFNRNTTFIPQSWNDLSLEQLYIVYQILYTDLPYVPNHEIRSSKRILLVQSFLRLSQQDMQAWENDFEPDERHLFLAELDALCACFDFLFEQRTDERNIYEVALSLTRCPYPHIEDTDGTLYHAPADALENITLYEMAQTFSLFEQYIRTHDLDTLHTLLATLYRPAKPETEHHLASGYEGDIRLPLMKHESTIAKRKARFSKLPEAAKQLLVFWYASCRQQIIKGYPNIFSNSADEQQGGNDYGWSGVLLSLADGLVNLDKVSEQNFANGLIYLSYLEDQRKLANLRAMK